MTSKATESFMQQTEQHIEQNFRHVNLWLGLFCAMILLLFSSLVINNSIHNVREELNTQIELTFNDLYSKLNSSTNILNGFSAYFHTVDAVDQKNLEEYSRSIRQQHPYINNTQYMVRVTRDELDDFIEQRHLEGYATFRITELDSNNMLVPAGDRDVYYPLVFIDPLNVRTAPLLGYDVYSSPSNRKAIDEAIRLGNNSATPPYDTPDGGLGFLIIRPIFISDNLPDDPQRRSELATRLVGVMIRIDDLIANTSINTSYSLTFKHIDTDKHIVRNIGAREATAQHRYLPDYRSTRQFTIAGQSFELSLTRQLRFSDLDVEWMAFALLATAALSLLLFNFVHLRIRSARERQRAQAELFREKELAEVTLHSIGEAVITTDTEQNIKYMNPIAEHLTGWRAEEALDRPLEEVFALVNEITREEVDSTVYECLNTNTTISFDDPTILLEKNGKEYSIESSAAPICDHSGRIIGAVLVFRNITHIRNLSRKMEFQATHDALTELINRREFERQLKKAVKSAREENHQHALCYLDLDQFKVVNDTCGHIAGDQLLRELAKIMPHSIRASDCLARLGGDEFGVLMFDCPLEQAEKVADNLRASIKDFTFSWDKKTFDIGVSIGLVPIDRNSGSLQDIMRRADSSCYIAKDRGRNRVHVYKPDDYELAKRHGEMQWLTRIQKALNENRFQLALQAVKPFNTENSVHQEVLIRMIDETGNVVPPMSFIPAAERYDMMPALDRWVISTTMSMIQDEIINGTLSDVYNINLSGQTLCEDDASDHIIAQLERFNIPPQHICFEITETAVIANLGIAIDFINKLKKIGCQFALDDFGSGLSSFTYLKKLPVDYLKIDGEFVRDIVNDPMDRAIVSAINDIGHEMKLKTVAEYVENKAILQLLQELGVDYVQGYGVDAPVAWYGSNVVPFARNN